MFLILFSIFLITISVISIYKKKFHLVFFPCMLFLPEYYALEISSSLPLLTVARMLFVTFYIYVFVLFRKNITKIFTKSTVNTPSFFYLTGYFLFRIISNLHYILVYSQAAKTILEIIFEQLLLIIAIKLIDFTKEDFDELLKIILLVSCIMFVLGIFESVTQIRITDSLYTVNRYMLNAHFPRLNILRATVTMGLPGFYGNFCALVLPIIIYLYENKPRWYYLPIVVLDIFACIHSGCRSSLIFIICLVLFIFLARIISRGMVKRFLFNTLIVVSSTILLATMLSFTSKTLNYLYVGTAKSILNEVGFSFDLDEDAPEGTEGYGDNMDGTTSRTEQLSGIIYVARINPIFGLGSGAQNRRQISYWRKDTWKPSGTYDVGYVQIFADEGIIGSIGFILLLIFVISILVKKPPLPAPYKSLIINLTITYLLCLLSTANMYNFLFFIVVLAAFRSQIYEC